MTRHTLATLHGHSLVYLRDSVEPWEQVLVRRAGHPDRVLFTGRGAGARSGCMYTFAGQYRNGRGAVEIAENCLGVYRDVAERVLREAIDGRCEPEGMR